MKTETVKQITDVNSEVVVFFREEIEVVNLKVTI